MKTTNLKIFFITLVCQFLITSLLYLGVRLPQFSFLNFHFASASSLVSPVTKPTFETNNPTFEVIQEKLDQKKTSTNFKLKKELSLVESAFAGQEFDQAKAYLVSDFKTGQVLAEKNTSVSLSIASLTKIMTAVISLDLADLEEKFSVSKEAALVEPTKIGVVPGQFLTVSELLEALLLTSANDAAAVLQEGIDQKYGPGSFVAAMNYKAKSLGLNNSHFTNPQGFDNPEHYSSVWDLSLLTQFALENYPKIKEIVAKDYQFLPESSDHKQFDLYNWNGLLGVYPGVKGVKIGNTDLAGKTTIVLSQRQEDKQVLVVLLGAPGVLQRDFWAAGLLDLGFKSLGLAPIEVSESQLKQKYATWKYWN